MAQKAWRCSQCGTVNEPGARACGACGRWASLFDMQDNAVEEAGIRGKEGLESETFETETVDSPRGGKRRMLSTAFWIGLVLLVVVVNFVVPRLLDDVDAVTPATLKETAGQTRQPFTGKPVCDVYVVPVDSRSESRAVELAQLLVWRGGAPVRSCSTSSFRLTASAVDEGREQLHSLQVLYQLKLALRSAWRLRPTTIIALTDLDMLATDWPGTWVTERRQGFAAISTARLGSGGDRTRRLEILGMRYLGFAYFGLPGNPDPRSALYPTIRELEDLDRMRPLFTDPPPTADELALARQRFLEG